MKHVLRVVGPLILAIGALGFDGCSVLDPAEEIPSYIHIDSIGLTINNATTEGTSSHRISDAWVYVDGELIGAFELPCNIPILKEGEHGIIVLAGIKQNGLSSTRAIYPKYKGWQGAVTLTRGQITSVNPVVQYYPVTNFMWMCDFDQAGTNIDDNTNTPYPGRLQEISGPNAFEGESGYVTLSTDTPSFYAQSSLSYTFDNSIDVYLEMNYNGNHPFAIGLFNTTTNSYIPWVQITPTGTWGKIYIRLNDAILTQPPGGVYHVYIAAQKSPDITNPWIAFDELKLIN